MFVTDHRMQKTKVPLTQIVFSRRLVNRHVRGGRKAKGKTGKSEVRAKRRQKHGLLHHTTINNRHGYERGVLPPMQSSVVQSINKEACLAVMTSMPPTD